jgi:prepilin-type N-terminal cleavage/methylation domain-containing protein
MSRSRESKNERGFSLIEMLVATAIFSIAAAVAFILYSAAQKSYKSGENFSDQQQATRVAFDRMISDLRLAGFNTNPDGDSTRIDEQIEGAWDTAVTIRGDFDFEDPTASATPEAALPGTAYQVVPTGNDEIVTYVLAKSGPSGPATAALRADVDKPRTKTLKDVTISNVALVHDNPPYTLYRVTLADVSTFPTTPPNASAFTFEPVADNIRSMQFKYYDDGGVLLNPATPANAADDIGGGDANVLARSRIRRIEVSLIGMTQDEDPQFTDTDAVAAARHYRKFDLQSDVNAENLGKAGVKDIDIIPPPSPTNVQLVPGHCQGVLVKWDNPPSSAGVTAYSVKYWPSGSPSSFTTAGFTYPHLEYGVVDYDGHGFVSTLTHGSNYCFQVQAKDSGGNQSGWAPASSPPCVTTTNTTPPGVPTNFHATGDGTIASLDSQVRLTWDQLKVNLGTITGDPDLISGATILRDQQGFKLYRDTVNTFSSAALQVVSTIGAGAVEYLDTTNIANCKTYYYKLSATDKCGTEGTATTVITGRAVTTIAPAKPTGANANRTAKTAITVTWSPVTTKSDGTTTYIDLYKVWRAMAPNGTDPFSIPAGSYTLRGTSTTTTFVDVLSSSGSGNDVNQLNSGQTFFYTVSAADLCGNESVRSDPAQVFCSYGGSHSTVPPDGGVGDNPIQFTLNEFGSGNWARARVGIPDPNAPTTELYFYNQIMSCSSAPCVYDLGQWTPSASGAYTANWEIEKVNGCIEYFSTTFNASGNEACQITPTNPNLSPTTGKPSDQNKKLSWDIINNAGVDLEINRIEVEWTEVVGQHRLVQIEYPTGTIIENWLGIPQDSSGQVLGASARSEQIFPPVLEAFRNGSCGSGCVLNMSILFDSQIKTTTAPITGETITIRYFVQSASGGNQECFFQVKPDLTVSGL